MGRHTVSLKPDKFTWIVAAIVVLLLAAAVITVNRTNPSATTPLTYRTDNTPETPIYNAFVAGQNGEFFKAREQYSQGVLEQIKRDDYDPFINSYRDSNTTRQLRIVSVDIDASDPQRAVVTMVEDVFYSGGGFLGSGNTWSNRRTIPVVQEDGVWKIDAGEFFF